METMNISLPESMKDFVDRQVSRGGFSSVSEYIRALVREEQKRQASEKLESQLLEGLNSEGSEMTRADWDELKQRVRERHGRRNAGRKAK